MTTHHASTRPGARTHSPEIDGASDQNAQAYADCATEEHLKAPVDMTIWGLTPTQLHDAYWKSRGVQCVRPAGPPGDNCSGAAASERAAGVTAHAPTIDRSAELYLLLQPGQLVFFDLADVINRVQWRGATVTRLWINLPPRETYAEHIDVDGDGYVRSIARKYHQPHVGQHRVFLTQSRRLARIWSDAHSPRTGWNRIRKRLRLTQVDRSRTLGHTFSTAGPDAPANLAAAMTMLINTWTRPDTTIIGIYEAAPGVFVRADAYTDSNVVNRHPALSQVCVGPVWLGDYATHAADDDDDVAPDRMTDQGARTDDTSRTCTIGPAWTADAGPALSALHTRRFIDIVHAGPHSTNEAAAETPTLNGSDAMSSRLRRSGASGSSAGAPNDGRGDRRSSRQGHQTAFAGTTTLIYEPGKGAVYPVAKRTFDIVASATVLVILLPLIAAVAAGIIITDGRPVFFRHRRQSRGGASFDCLKFRTMTNNADQSLSDINSLNQCDGPQVYIPNDPRITRFGALLRTLNIDEIPQFWNVLTGDMSIVGPRPSPDKENQLCPAWRDLRLSVRPGVTGLWQLKRTRAPGQDFQEWIQYDIEYVRNASFMLDLKICFLTARLLLFGSRSGSDGSAPDDKSSHADNQSPEAS